MYGDDEADEEDDSEPSLTDLAGGDPMEDE
jgi:hypothetical protein